MSTWIKLHDNFATNLKVLAAGEDAAWLYVCGLLFCSANETDGRIPTAALRSLTAKKDARSLARILVREGLWSETATGWQVHDYLKVQRSKAQIEAERQKARDRKARSRSSHAVTPAVTDGDVTQPETEAETDTETAAAAPDPEQLILHTARLAAQRRATGRDVGEGWIVNATRGIANDQRAVLLAHIKANPHATPLELVEIIDPIQRTPQRTGGVMVDDDLGVFLPGSGWCKRQNA